MRSSEVAALAGVSVRTLRHYHQYGILPEPARHENGYRDYTARDLARLLRIKHLASLGFSLSQIAALLDETPLTAKESPSGLTPLGPSAAKALDELDAELAQRIGELQEQRRIIAQLKAEQLAPDLPLRFARILQALDDCPAMDELDAQQRVVLLLAGHLYNGSELDELEAVVKALQNNEVAANLDTVQNHFAALAPHATEEERARLVDEALTLLAPLIACFDSANWQGDSSVRDYALKSAAHELLNPAQIDVAERIERRISETLQDCVQEKLT